MHELPFHEYALARPLFHTGLETYTALRFDAAQAGTMAARLWVDDPTAPRTALLWDRHLCFDLAGDADDSATIGECATLWADLLLPHVQEQAPWCKVRYTLPAWEVSLPAIFGAAPLLRRVRRLYRFEEARVPAGAAQVPPEFALVDVDAAFLRRTELAHHEIVRREIASCWRTPQAYLEAGLGVCLVREGSVVAWCLGEYASAGRIGIGIETVQVFQGQGLAAALAAAFVERCLARQITPYWDCWADNTPSWRVAEKAGFRLVQAYPAGIVDCRPPGGADQPPAG